MKLNNYKALLAVVAVVCIAFAFLKASFAGVFTAVMAFPFEQIGMGLRALSLSGAFGNVAAFAIYIAIGLSPVAILLLLWRRRKLFPEDGLLVLLCVMLFIALYLMINPGFLSAMTGGTTAGGVMWQAVGKAILGGVVYSVICGYFVLRALRLFSQNDVQRLFLYTKIMLYVTGVIFICLAFGTCFGSLTGSITSLQAGNEGNEHLLGASYVFLVLRFIADALPYFLSALVTFAAIRLLGELQTDRYSIEAVLAAERMSRLCIFALKATVLTSIVFNMLQLLFANELKIIDVSVNIPVFSMVFVLAALLLTRFVAENKQLKDENNAFI
jgi:hypothetical protein